MICTILNSLYWLETDITSDFGLAIWCNKLRPRAGWSVWSSSLQFLQWRREVFYLIVVGLTNGIKVQFFCIVILSYSVSRCFFIAESTRWYLIQFIVRINFLKWNWSFDEWFLRWGSFADVISNVCELVNFEFVIEVFELKWSVRPNCTSCPLCTLLHCIFA